MVRRLKRISPTLHQQAAKVVHRQHQLQAYGEVKLLRAALEHLLYAGAGVDELTRILSQPDWENRLAECIIKLGLAE